MESNLVSGVSSPTVGSVGTNSLDGLGSDDFFKLLIAQLSNQDPLEPTSNEQLMRQISSIREIELSTTMTDSLRQLTGQQRFASVSSMIGQHVTGVPEADKPPASGMVVGVRFSADGSPTLLLSSGEELPIDKVGAVASPVRAAEALIGTAVMGVDRRDPSEPRVVEGVVTQVRTSDNGEVLLELDSGDDVRFRDLVSLAAAA